MDLHQGRAIRAKKRPPRRSLLKIDKLLSRFSLARRRRKRKACKRERRIGNFALCGGRGGERILGKAQVRAPRGSWRHSTARAFEKARPKLFGNLTVLIPLSASRTSRGVTLPSLILNPLNMQISSYSRNASSGLPFACPSESRCRGGKRGRRETRPFR